MVKSTGLYPAVGVESGEVSAVGLAGDVEAVGTAMGAARKAVRRRAWDLAGESAPTAGISAAFPSVIDIDATLVDVHLREGGCGADRQEGVRLPPPDRLDRPRVWWWGGEWAVTMLRPGNDGSNRVNRSEFGGGGVRIVAVGFKEVLVGAV